MRGFVLLMLVIVIEFVHWARTGLDQQKDEDEAEEEERNASERLDVSFLPQAGDPALLNLLSFLLDQFFLDIRPHLGE